MPDCFLAVSSSFPPPWLSDEILDEAAHKQLWPEHVQTLGHKTKVQKSPQNIDRFQISLMYFLAFAYV